MVPSWHALLRINLRTSWWWGDEVRFPRELFEFGAPPERVLAFDTAYDLACEVLGVDGVVAEVDGDVLCFRASSMTAHHPRRPFVRPAPATPPVADDACVLTP